MVDETLGPSKGGSMLVLGTNNADRECTTAKVRKYWQSVRTLKQTRVEQIIMVVDIAGGWQLTF